MPKQIIWSPLSEKDFADILEYLYDKWGEKVASNFIDITDDLLEHILINPKQFPIVNEKRNIRKCVITKQNTLFYRPTEDHIHVLRIYDTRQNPKKLKFK